VSVAKDQVLIGNGVHILGVTRGPERDGSVWWERALLQQRLLIGGLASEPCEQLQSLIRV
jgi:hypothetical protein